MVFSDIDLRALAAFDAVRRTGSVTRAAGELGLPQSTLSNRLKRLRAQLGDPLFVKTSGGMMPTPFAEKIGAGISDAIAALDRAFETVKTFDAYRESRNFKIVMTNITEIVLLPKLLDTCKDRAPGISFTTESLEERDTEEALKDGTADLAIGFFPNISRHLFQRSVMKSEYACIAARDHPVVGSSIDRRRFLAARHAVAESRGTGHAVVERALRNAGVAHNIGARVSGFLPLLMIVGRSDMIATVPRLLAEVMCAQAGIKVMRHPLELPQIEIKQFWHERFHRDPGNVWLRGLLSDLYQGIAAEASAP